MTHALITITLDNQNHTMVTKGIEYKDLLRFPPKEMQ
jgi:hypothetical protein